MIFFLSIFLPHFFYFFLLLFTCYFLLLLRILDLSVMYLKGATSDVVDSAVHEIKNVVSEQTRL